MFMSLLENGEGFQGIFRNISLTFLLIDGKLFNVQI